MKNSNSDLLLLYFFSIFLIFTSCKDDDDNHNHHHHENGDVKIEILQPLNHSTFKNGDTLNIEVVFTGNDQHGLHDISVIIKDDFTKDEVFEFKIHAQHNIFTLDTFLVVDVTKDADWHFIAKADDHHQNESMLTYHLHIEK